MSIEDIVTTSTSKDVFLAIDGRNIVMEDNLIIFQLDHRIIDLMKKDLHDRINSIIVLHLPIESGLAQYKNDLGELIDYIIYYQQNQIVYDGFGVFSRKPEFTTAAKEVIQQHQRHITKNDYELFPVPETSCFDMDPAQFHFVLSSKKVQDQSYFCNSPAVTTEEENGMIIEKFVYTIMGHYSKIMSSFSPSITTGKDIVTVTRKVPKELFLKVMP